MGILLSKISTIPRIIRPVLASVLLTGVLLGIAYLLFMTNRFLPPVSPTVIPPFLTAA